MRRFHTTSLTASLLTLTAALGLGSCVTGAPLAQQSRSLVPDLAPRIERVGVADVLPMPAIPFDLGPQTFELPSEAVQGTLPLCAPAVVISAEPTSSRAMPRPALASALAMK